MSKKISSSDFVRKIIDEISEWVLFSLHLRSKHDKTELRSELADEVKQLNNTITTNKKELASSISAVSSREAANHQSLSNELSNFEAEQTEKEEAAAKALHALNNQTGGNRWASLQEAFVDSNYLDGCETIVEAILILDEKLAEYENQ